MTDQSAIIVKNVSKTFKLPHEKNTSVKSAVINSFQRNRTFEKQQVLNDISFDVKKGEFFGIVGRNGSGKSTLLKMLAGIYVPSKGEVTVNGKLTPFIELGVGFNPELTGRENVYLNGSLLGFSRKEMSEMYDQIVEFAELKRFMDQKLKNYSSGMQVRLAFSIAIKAQSDILVLDEVLAVGDESFQRKCLEVFEAYKKNKQTIILVTHDMETVKRFCSRALLLKEGRIHSIGNPVEVAEEYSYLNSEIIESSIVGDNTRPKSGLTAYLRNKSGIEADRFNYDEEMEVEVLWAKNVHVQNVGIAIYSVADNLVYATNTFIDKEKIHGNNSKCKFTLKIGPGKYYIMAGTFLDRPEKKVDFLVRGPSFIINPETKIKGEGIVRLVHQWKQGD